MESNVKIELITEINAPIEKCFDLSRSIDLHMESTKQTGERAIGGTTSGLIGLGETVTWQAKHFGIWQTLTSKMTGFQPPIFSSGRTTGAYFEDTMVTGAFKSFNHGHHFSPRDNNKTEMLDVFVFESPMGILGRLADVLFLKRYMTKLLIERNRVIKAVGENKSRL